MLAAQNMARLLDRPLLPTPPHVAVRRRFTLWELFGHAIAQPLAAQTRSRRADTRRAAGLCVGTRSRHGAIFQVTCGTWGAAPTPRPIPLPRRPPRRAQRPARALVPIARGMLPAMLDPRGTDGGLRGAEGRAADCSPTCLSCVPCGRACDGGRVGRARVVLGRARGGLRGPGQHAIPSRVRGELAVPSRPRRWSEDVQRRCPGSWLTESNRFTAQGSNNSIYPWPVGSRPEALSSSLPTLCVPPPSREPWGAALAPPPWRPSPHSSQPRPSPPSLAWPPPTRP